MAAIDLQGIRQSYYDNADYEDSGDLSKARAFRTACVRLLALNPQELLKEGDSLQMPDARRVEVQLSYVRNWIAGNEGASDPSKSRAKYLDFRTYRV